MEYYQNDPKNSFIEMEKQLKIGIESKKKQESEDRLRKKGKSHEDTYVSKVKSNQVTPEDIKDFDK